jgi:hypothetical protein
MSMEIKEPAELADATQLLPPHLREKFERIDREIEAAYGYAPGVPRLVRLWLACGTGSQIRREFELAVLDANVRTIQPNANGEFDEDCL